jgi:LPXTG-site transpeptidase (sortase) family protein
MDDIRPILPKNRIGLGDQTLRGRGSAPRRVNFYDRPHATRPVVSQQMNSMSTSHPKPGTHHVKAPVHQNSAAHHAKAPAHDESYIARPAPRVTEQHKPTQPSSPVKTLEQHAQHLYAPKKRPDIPKQQRSGVLKREALAKKSKKLNLKLKRPLMPTLMTAMAVVLFSVGVFAVISSLRTDKTVKAQVEQLATQASDDDGMTSGMPSEEDPPKNIGSYSVAPDLPKFLSIDKLDVKARVRKLGVGPNNVLKAPANIYDVGWYEGSAKPGENGTVVMDGHVSGPTKHGVFYSLGTLKEGDKVSVERGDGKVFTYSVTGSQVYDNDKVDMPRLMTTSVPGKPAMNLITCTGRFNVRTNQFEQRVVVFTVLDR